MEGWWLRIPPSYNYNNPLILLIFLLPLLSTPSIHIRLYTPKSNSRICQPKEFSPQIAPPPSKPSIFHHRCLQEAATRQRNCRLPVRMIKAWLSINNQHLISTPKTGKHTIHAISLSPEKTVLEGLGGGLGGGDGGSLFDLSHGGTTITSALFPFALPVSEDLRAGSISIEPVLTFPFRSSHQSTQYTKAPSRAQRTQQQCPSPSAASHAYIHLTATSSPKNFK